ncbi:hypothetical protein MHEL_26800 [Mycolicibacterium helvum]|uniref:Uncharacterized protein n=1 Tax=Mycolicibacterium helvum TaxID=1534349 RepID=A0A7I7T593_9MYCO|nr:hypothetical protein MHEL_26800 [Mycolicibacterium helvum]
MRTHWDAKPENLQVSCGNIVQQTATLSIFLRALWSLGIFRYASSSAGHLPAGVLASWESTVRGVRSARRSGKAAGQLCQNEFENSDRAGLIQRVIPVAALG